MSKKVQNWEVSFGQLKALQLKALELQAISYHLKSFLRKNDKNKKRPDILRSVDLLMPNIDKSVGFYHPKFQVANTAVKKLLTKKQFFIPQVRPQNR